MAEVESENIPASYSELRAEYEERRARSLAHFESNRKSFDEKMDLYAPVNWTPQARAISSLNQGDVTKKATCTAFATAATIGDIHLLRSGEISRVSPLHLHVCIADYPVTEAIGPLTLAGLISGRQLGQLEMPPQTSYLQGHCGHSVSPSSVTSGTDVYTEQTKYYLSYGPLVAILNVPESFWTFRGSVFSTPGTGDLHSVELLGWDAEGWFIRNSQGSQWGDGAGFCKIQIGYCDLTADGPQSGSVFLNLA